MGVFTFFKLYKWYQTVQSITYAQHQETQAFILQQFSKNMRGRFLANNLEINGTE